MFIKKHQYIEGKFVEIGRTGDLRVGFRFRKCIYCGHDAGLDEEEVSRLPFGMARCKVSPVKAGLMEILKGKVDCRGD